MRNVWGEEEEREGERQGISELQHQLPLRSNTRHVQWCVCVCVCLIYRSNRRKLTTDTNLIPAQSILLYPFCKPMIKNLNIRPDYHSLNKPETMSSTTSTDHFYKCFLIWQISILKALQTKICSCCDGSQLKELKRWNSSNGNHVKGWLKSLFERTYIDFCSKKAWICNISPCFLLKVHSYFHN